MKQDLLGRICVVTGASGRVGAGVAAALLDHGATVVLPSRDADRAEQLVQAHGDRSARVLPLVADLADEQGATRVRDAVLARFGRVDHVVASFGCAGPGASLVSLDLEGWRASVSARLEAHFLTARTFLPLLQPGGTYALVSGADADDAPPGAGLRVVADGGLHALARALRVEVRAEGVRFDEVRLGCEVDAPPGGLAARRLGDVFVALATGAAIPAVPLRIDGEADVADLLSPARVRAGT
jgi:3-oxoacyl-[acyl-carrier protein] reductase